MAARSEASRARAQLLKFALAYPGAFPDSPWGEKVVKVGKKIFVFLGRSGGELQVTVKLPRSAMLALGLPFASPTGYGLGKSGWVTASFRKNAKPPIAMLKQWIDESYRAVAPARLAKQIPTAEQ
jgi:predicted DNA-binding protein (MmcQ/YjbR family)